MFPENIYTDYTDTGKKHAEKLYWKLRKKYMPLATQRVIFFDLVEDIKSAKMFGKWGDFYPNALKVMFQVSSAVIGGDEFKYFLEYQGCKESMTFRDIHYKIFEE